MAVAVKMPQLGETVVEGTVARWLKTPGDSITRLEPLLEISTDKIDTEVPAPAAGTLLNVLVAEGETVRAGEILAYIGEEGESVQAGASVEPAADAVAQNAAKQAEKAQAAPTNGDGLVTPPDTTHSGESRPGVKPAGRDFISPVVANIAREHAVDLAQVPGTGLGGRITKKDILAHLEQATAPTDSYAQQAVRHASATPQPAPTQSESTAATSSEDESWQPLSTMRRLIAEHMVASKRTSPHVTSIFEVDMTAVVRHRENHKRDFAKRGLRLTYTPYFIAAAAHALRQVPQVNARFHEQLATQQTNSEQTDNQARQHGMIQSDVMPSDVIQRGIIQNRRVHIGIAVALPEGLVVPVIRDADERNLAGLARALNDLAQAAQDQRLAPDATQSGTFTITNHGTSGSLMGTPIINQPQGAILGVGAITKRPVVRSASPSLLPSAEDAIVIRPMCYLSLTFDHRLIDGATADEFLTTVQQVLEHWQDEHWRDE